MKRVTAYLCVVVLLVLTSGVSIALAQQDTGMVSFVNFIGEELNVTVDGNEDYIVPGTDTAPGGGRLDLEFAPGAHDFSLGIGSAPGINMAVDVLSGSSSVFGVVTEAVPPQSSLKQKAWLKVFDIVEPIPPAAGVAEPVEIDAAPSQPTTSDVVPPQPETISQATIVVVNYIGEPLTFTMNDKSQVVAPAGGEMTLPVAPGTYNYTIGVPSGRGADNTVALSAGQTARLSCSLLYDPNHFLYNTDGNLLLVYTEIE